MSVVIVIVSVVAVMGLEATSIYVGRTAYSSTRDKLAAIDQALSQYYRVTGRLPCPADRTLAESYSGSSSFGFENCGSLVLITGSVVTVGIKAGGSGYSAGNLIFSTAGPAGTYTVNGGAIATTTVTTSTSNFSALTNVTAPGGSGAQLVAGHTFVYYGTVPTAELGLPVSAGIDAYGSRINYIVTQGLTNAYTFADTPANIEVRSGLLREPCSGTCSIIANPAASPPSGAAYFLFSHGADKRGAITRAGNATFTCLPSPTTSFDQAIDSQNCAAIHGTTLDTASIGGTIPRNVFYDSRYNTGNGVEANKFDDIVLWRTKGQL